MKYKAIIPFNEFRRDRLKNPSYCFAKQRGRAILLVIALLFPLSMIVGKGIADCIVMLRSEFIGKSAVWDSKWRAADYIISELPLGISVLSNANPNQAASNKGEQRSCNGCNSDTNIANRKTINRFIFAIISVIFGSILYAFGFNAFDKRRKICSYIFFGFGFVISISGIGLLLITKFQWSWGWWF
jgi:hypothetical protein